MTGHAGIFAGGDMAPAERNVTVGVGHGKKAANIDAWLRGTTTRRRRSIRLATFERLNTWYYSDAPKTVRPMLDHPPSIDVRRGSAGGSTRATRCSKRGGACPAATASSATTAMASAPTTR